MEDQAQDQNSNNHSSHRSSSSTTETVRSRWTPKPEQILILESIFNSGMVNPPKDETVRIRKMLEKFGAVGDANVFYWFQNRRSRSRRRQRQLQAAGLVGEQPITSNNCLQQQQGVSGGAIQCNHSLGFASTSPCFRGSSSNSSFYPGQPSSSSSVGDNGEENLYTMSGQLGFQEFDQHSSTVTSVLCPTDQASNILYQHGFITVFINGVATEVPTGSIDMKAMLGENVILVHSSGVPIPVNDFGFLMQSLQHGESYFLVPKPT